MEIFRRLEDISLLSKNTALAIGNFDGLHLGHQKILRFLVGGSQKKGLFSFVLTFSPHPEQILGRNKIYMIQTLEQRLQRMEEFGVQAVLVASFNQRFSSLSSRDFVRKIVVQSLNTQEVIVGENFRFGKNQKGDILALRLLGREFGFEVHSISPLTKKGQVVSSSLIRNLLQEGKIEQANEFLGYFYGIEGDVIPGDARGKSIGFPTANILTPNEILPRGVFITLARVGPKKFPSLTNIGIRPTFSHKKLIIESHIIGFRQDIYGEPIHIIFLKKVRDEMKFKTSSTLSLQIKKDLEKAKIYFQKKRDLLSL